MSTMRKLTRKGKKNKTFLGRKRRKLKSAAQVYMCSLRNKKFAKELARKRKRKSQQETRKRWNNTYINQPTRIHISMRECITKDPENPRPKVEDYLGTCDSGESHGNCFESLEQAETFWRPIWEIEGNGNADALSWLKEIESAMDTCCDIARQMNDDPICVCKDHIEKAIRKKKNMQLLVEKAHGNAPAVQARTETKVNPGKNKELGAPLAKISHAILRMNWI